MESISPVDPWAAPLTQVAAFIGLLWVSTKILSFWRVIASLFILPGKPLSTFGGKGTWAVVTGASDGIGKEYALQLAAKGFDILLISRTQTKLDALAQEITSNYNVKTQTFAIDFAANADADYDRLRSAINTLGSSISILINNVGMSHAIPVPFAETDDREMRDIITINCTATLRVTAMIAPLMVKQRRGLILSMASFGGVFPTPLLATYSGSKAFLQQWSTALSAELAPYNVTVQLVQSHLVTSAMSKIKRASLLVPTPKMFVKAALSKIGRSGGAQGIKGTSTPYWAHAIMQWAITTFTGGTSNGMVVGINKRMHEDIRRRAQKKAARASKNQ